jgi:hypothetical protein
MILVILVTKPVDHIPNLRGAISRVIVVATAPRTQAGFLVTYGLPWLWGTNYSRGVSI